jgi:uncharacterized Fe-S center protein
MASTVYYMNARSASLETGLVSKLLAVFDAAGFDKLIKPKDVVAIKTHCGEWNNTGYLRPVYARALVDRVKSLGGRPFVCDTTTLPYSPYASRVTELDFLTTAERNGYSPAVLGCPFICADGFMGTDDYRVELPEGYILKEAFIATAIAAADVLITLTHFKGHIMGVIGGAIKNLGIGAQSKRGKFNVHMGGHPRYGFAGTATLHPEKLAARNNGNDGTWLEDLCPYGLVHVTDTSIEWDQENCPACRACMGPMTSCGVLEVRNANQEAANAAIADACLAAIKAWARVRSRSSTWRWISRLDVTVRASATCPLFRIWGSSPAMTRWRLTRHASTRRPPPWGSPAPRPPRRGCWTRASESSRRALPEHQVSAKRSSLSPARSSGWGADSTTW